MKQESSRKQKESQWKSLQISRKGQEQHAAQQKLSFHLVIIGKGRLENQNDNSLLENSKTHEIEESNHV